MTLDYNKLKQEYNLWSESSEFFLSLSSSSQFLAPVNSNILLNQKLSLSGEGFQFRKEFHSYIDFLAFMGAVFYSIYSLISLLIGPIQRHSYKLRAIKRLYFARGDSKDIFGYDHKKNQSNLIYRSNPSYDQKVNQ